MKKVKFSGRNNGQNLRQCPLKCNKVKFSGRNDGQKLRQCHVFGNKLKFSGRNYGQTDRKKYGFFGIFWHFLQNFPNVLERGTHFGEKVIFAEVSSFHFFRKSGNRRSDFSIFWKIMMKMKKKWEKILEKMFLEKRKIFSIWRKIICQIFFA